MRLDICEYPHRDDPDSESPSNLLKVRYEAFESGIMSTKLGRKWLDVNLLDWSDDVRSIVISCSLKGKGTVGIWAPNSDYLSDEKDNAERTLDYSRKGISQTIAHSECSSWNFGSEASITLYRPSGLKDKIDINFKILLRPQFNAKDDLCEIDIAVNDKSNNKNLLDDHSKSTISALRFGLGEEENLTKVELMRFEYGLMNELGSYNLEGNGNIAHPKQYFTIHGLKQIMDKYLRDNNKLIIGYIGTDTTENFCSLFRWLEHSGYIDRVELINVYYTNDWDSDFISWIDNEHPLNSSDKVLTWEDDDGLIEEQKNCDVVISTYVTPWVGFDDKKYSKLIKKILGDKSLLLSVDPQNAKSSVRSVLKNHKTNNDDLYTYKLSLIPAKAPITRENTSVEYSIWKKKTK
jgi:hypothetical protein